MSGDLSQIPRTQVVEGEMHGLEVTALGWCPFTSNL